MGEKTRLKLDEPIQTYVVVAVTSNISNTDTASLALKIAEAFAERETAPR